MEMNDDEMAQMSDEAARQQECKSHHISGQDQILS